MEVFNSSSPVINSSSPVIPKFDPRWRRATDLWLQSAFFPKENCRRVSWVICRRANKITREQYDAKNKINTEELSVPGLRPMDNQSKNDKAVDIESVSPSSLSENDFSKIHEITQDMWARWLWEFLECDNCSYIASKDDIFGSWKYGITSEGYKKTIAFILSHMDDNDQKKIYSCPHCNSAMSPIYWNNYKDEIKSRLLDTESYLTVCRVRWEIVWYMDFFVASPEEAYERDWKRHYEGVGFSEIDKRISLNLGYTPKKIICFTAMGLLEEYSNFFTIYTLLNTNFQSAPKSIYKIPWATELNKDSWLYNIYRLMWSNSLHLTDDINWLQKLKHIKGTYKSDIVTFPSPVETFMDNFSMSIRQFLRRYWSWLKNN